MEQLPFFGFSYNGHHECVYHLLNHKANVNLTKNIGASPLFVAARNGHHRIVKKLLKMGANGNLCQQDMRSPLQTALLFHRKRCMKLLLKWNVYLITSDIHGCYPIHYAAMSGNIKAVRIITDHLISRKLYDPSIRDKHGNSALHTTLTHNTYDLANYLISEKFNVNQ
ncbi:unnamed protein product [Didymodactylos carnosus]|uniref:Uncharacterized protein n=1 Tax=Didymodactylos carnosus TaxID=1234261 RepID=A0A813S537_9BILA|nr:unnamed protein product [Didymodactylos carnosus]CAF3574450.1 unnamed protein product [Didymodactylos carnosus]